MPLPTTNISMNDIHIEVGGSSGTTVSLNDADVRGIGNPNSTYDGGDGINTTSGSTISIGEFRGAEDTAAFELLTANANGVRNSSSGLGMTGTRTVTSGIVFLNPVGLYAKATLNNNVVTLEFKEYNSASTSTYYKPSGTQTTLSTTYINSGSRTYASGAVDAMKINFSYQLTDSTGTGSVQNAFSGHGATYGPYSFHTVSNGQSVGGGIYANATAECYTQSERSITVTATLTLRGTGYNDTVVATHTGSFSSFSNSNNCF